MSINSYRSNSGAVKRGVDLDLNLSPAKRSHIEESTAANTSATRVAVEALPALKEKDQQVERSLPPQVSPTPASSQAAIVKATTTIADSTLLESKEKKDKQESLVYEAAKSDKEKIDKIESFETLLALETFCKEIRGRASTFEGRMKLFLNRCTRRLVDQKPTFSLLISIKPDRNLKVILNVYRESTSEFTFATRQFHFSPLYHFDVHELNNEETLGYHADYYCLKLRATEEGTYGEISQVGNAVHLRGRDINQIYLTLEPLFSGEWCVMDAAEVERVTKDNQTHTFFLKFTALGDLRGTWYQRAFGYREVATLEDQNPTTYAAALTALRSYTISHVWTFLKKYPCALKLKTIYNYIFNNPPKSDLIERCTKTLQQVHATLLSHMSTSTTATARETAECMHSSLLGILFDTPEGYKENSSLSAEEILYWDQIEILDNTDVFIKRLP